MSIVPASTTAKTYTKAAIEKACSKVHTRILEEMANSSFVAPMDLACKLYAKYLKEELSK